MPRSTSQQIALVTGAGSGIRRAVARKLHSAGYSVVAAGRRAAELERTAASASSSNGLIVPIPTDVSNPDSVKLLFDRIREMFGRLDILFNNTGTNAPGISMQALTYEQWNAVIGVNLTGAFLCAKEAMKLMKTQDPRGGRIINNGSLSSHVPRPNSTPYTVTKYDIACGQTDVGNAATEMTENMASGVRQADGTMTVSRHLDSVLLGRSPTPPFPFS